MNVKLNKWFFHQERKLTSFFRPNLVHYSWKVPETIYNQRRIIKYHLVTCYLQIFNVNIPFFFWVQVKRLWTTWSHLLINTNICIKKKKKKLYVNCNWNFQSHTGYFLHSQGKKKKGTKTVSGVVLFQNLQLYTLFTPLWRI